MKLYLPISLFIAWLLPQFLLAQPIRSAVFPNREAQSKKLTSAFRIEAGPTTLPFYDDFHYSTSTGFNTRWQNSGVTLISNRVFFDGFNATNGVYSTDTTLRVLSDELLSQSVDFSTAAEQKIVFEWQGGANGNGIAPDSSKGDRLFLAVRNKNQEWDTLWRSPSRTTAITTTEVILSGSDYQYNDLQFKFQAIGISGKKAANWYISKVEITNTLAGTLPFWEDFSSEVNYRNNFKSNTGVYINNHLAANQPTVNVASFDGLDDQGSFYYKTNYYEIGLADSLVSYPIDLSAPLSPADSLYFSFFWEKAGYGEIPDLRDGDSLVLQFYTKAGKWKSVWQSPLKDTIETTLHTFFPALLKVTDSSFFHKDFKFKFMNYGRLSGPFDLWHIDYIVMDTIKSTIKRGLRSIIKDQLYVSDYSISKSPTSPIAPYYAMPAHHLQSIPFADTISYSISNLSLESRIEFAYTVSKVNGGLVQQSVKGIPDTLNIQHGILPVKQLFTEKNAISPNLTSFDLVIKAYLSKVRVNNPDTSRYLLYQNDTLTTTVPFRDYYAYDDGTYEYTGMLKQEDGIHAVQFTAQQADTLTHLDISFPYSGHTIQNNDIFLKVWASDNGKPGKELFKQIEQIQYSVGRNPFTRYAFKRTILIPQGDFFVGIQQLSGNNNAARIGLDLNNDTKNKYWYDNAQGTGWTQEYNLTGSFMIRPVFAAGALNNLPKTRTEMEVSMHPNPNSHAVSNGVLHFNAVYDRIQIIDIVKGNTLINEYYTDKIDLNGIETGMYIVKVILDGVSSSQKLIYQH